ncbi:MAG: mucoidy inhibitor MuiA family protein, partial [Bacteroidota bacterium]
MKTYIILLTALLLSGFQVGAYSQNELEVDSKIQDVTVFLRGAQVTRSTSTSLKSGKNVLIFRGLADGIDAKSIQVAAPQDVLINSVTKETNYLNRQKPSPRIKALQDSTILLRDLLELEKDARAILKQESDMLLKNQSLGSEKDGVDIDELQKAADFFRKRFGEIKKEMVKIGKTEKKYREAQTRIKKQLKELNYQKNRPSNDIRVTLNCFNPTRAEVLLQYLVANAGWVPNYDLRAKDSQNPIRLDYKADVYQNTGIDWKDVQLTLSSGNPNLGGTQPTLEPWNLYVQVYRPTPKRRKSGMLKKSASAPAAVYDRKAETEESIEEEDAEDDYWEDSETLADYT